MVVPIKDRVIEVRPPERIVRAEPGPRRLFICLDGIKDGHLVKRHWKDGHTVPCDCEGPCPTARDDIFVRAVMLHHVDSDNNRWWEPVVLHLTDDAMRRAETAVQMAGIVGGTAGLMFRLGREGSSRQSRVVITEVSKIPSPPTTCTSVAMVLAMRRIAGYYPLFKGAGPKPEESANADATNGDQVIPPARSRSDKPRVSKGCGPCHQSRKPRE